MEKIPTMETIAIRNGDLENGKLIFSVPKEKIVKMCLRSSKQKFLSFSIFGDDNTLLCTVSQTDIDLMIKYTFSCYMQERYEQMLNFKTFFQPLFIVGTKNYSFKNGCINADTSLQFLERSIGTDIFPVDITEQTLERYANKLAKVEFVFAEPLTFETSGSYELIIQIVCPRE